MRPGTVACPGRVDIEELLAYKTQLHVSDE